MGNLFNTLREKIFLDQQEVTDDEKEVEYLICLGVLLCIVAEADEKFLPQEQQQLEEVLKTYSEISDEDMPIVLRSIEEANILRIDVHSFTKDINQNLSRDSKIEIIENLFRVACADKDLDESEHEAIRQISGLFGLDHKEFIDSKIKIKKEFGMDVAGS